MKTLLATLAVSTALLAPASAQEAGSRDARGQLDFEGRYIVSVQDADMVSSAYVNGQLGPREGRDTLAVIPLDGDPRDWTASEVFASNSVAGPPAAVDITPDGRLAFVVETFTPRPDDDDPHSFSDKSIGSTLTVVSLANPTAPEVRDRLKIGDRPLAVRVNTTGDILAISYAFEGGSGGQTPMQLFRINADGTLSDPVSPTIEGYPLGEDNIMDMDWHPEENLLAIIDQFGNSMRFARVTDDLAVEPFGNVVDIDRAPYRVMFTPDGSHVVANALYWGPDIAGRWIEAPRGQVVTVRMNAEVSDDGAVRHALVDRVMTGVSPEGLAVSPDGRWVATTNLERSYLPYDDPRITWYSSVTLAALDQETGDLTEIGTFNYDGILPEAAVFDNSGNYLAVANYDHFDDRVAGSSIDFWRIQADPLDPGNTQLIKTEHSVPVARGAHSMVIAR
ncbi:beta-propeller fold lactonase family protein [Denitrobaculum tricleocarpae]|uniref:beta-propeller fold lactonase family protein n=1 Tax=Denitrobaculum tricleocarpae TaxID=2591009 RepID=UPI001C5519C6|nr:beta-propeller fold lactonase family protein [Denitrobaculum tricleocarpae]